jgi:tetratricopeptide (TPR) repeat protein
MERDAGNLTEAERAFKVVLSAGIKGKDDFDLYWAKLGLGDVLVQRGNLPGALDAYRGASAEADRLAKADPNNAGWQRDLAVSYAKLGNVYRRAGEPQNARDSLLKGKEIMERMTKLSPDNAVWQKDLAWFGAQIAALDK